jgi:hypothetical protein
MLKEIQRVLALAIFIVFMASLSSIAYSQVSFISGPEAVSTGHDEETSCVVVDAEGNAHIVWASEEGTFLFYKMVDKDGIMLIDETNLNPCALPESYHVRRPSIALDPSGGLHIVFHGWMLYTDLGATEYETSTILVSSEVIYTKINPYDYYEGGQSDINDLIVIPETIISTEDDIKSRAPNVALDPSNSRLHVVWYEGNEELSLSETSLSINYLVLDLDGNAITTEASLTSGLPLYVMWGEPEIASDPDGNAHIVYCYSTLGEDWPYNDREIFYTMVTVTGGIAIILIDDTEITVADGHASCRPHLAVDSEGMVHVVWHDRWLSDAATGEHEIFYSKLDPSLDDQDGDSADPSEISVISEFQISSNNSRRSNQKNITIDEHDRIHVTWSDGDEYELDRDVYYALFDSSGDILTPVEPEMVVMSGGNGLSPIAWLYSSGRHPEIFTYCDRVYITFNVIDLINVYFDIYLTILSVPTPPAIPTGVSASDGAYTDRIEVSWDSVTCTDEYIVNRSDSDSDYGEEIAETTDTSYTDDDPGLIPDRRYYYWVRANNSFGPSDFSDPDTGYVRAVSDGEDGKKNGCFIATAAYGSPLHPNLDILRDFRDRYLMYSKLGRKLIDLYYEYSPFAADFIAKHKVLRVAVRINLLPLVVFSYSMLHFGPTITAFMLAFVFALPIFFIWFYRRK